VQLIVGVSDAKFSQQPSEQIVTYSLGSCIGVTAYDPVAKCGGMLHYQLPTSTMDADRARQNPCMFADTGMTHLLNELASRGAMKKRLKITLAGGAQILDDAGVFSIGRRNHTAIRKILWQHGIMAAAEDVGGTSPRTMYLNMSDGQASIKTNGTTTTL
jgi:chemotaxis protein CheD